jgi:hypothetical protein
MSDIYMQTNGVTLNTYHIHVLSILFEPLTLELVAIGDNRHGLKPCYCLGIGDKHVWIKQRLTFCDVELCRSISTWDR